jgi:hypothetical protein
MSSVLKYVSPEARFAQEKRKRQSEEHEESRKARARQAALKNIAAHNLLTSDQPTQSLSASQILRPNQVHQDGRLRFRGRQAIPYGTPGYTPEEVARSERRASRGNR